MNVALIPARSGSKRVPHKNIRELGGKPLLVYSIEAALSCPSIFHVVVSTDSEQYAEIARAAGASVLMRPDKYSDDQATDYEVIQHFLDHVDVTVDNIIYLRPTTPLRKIHIIERAIAYLYCFDEEMQATGLRSIEELPESAFKSLILPGGIYLHGISHQTVDDAGRPNNSYLTTYKGNGYVDIILPGQVKNGELFGNKCVGFKTDPITEVDTEREFKFLEYELKQNGGKHVY